MSADPDTADYCLARLKGWQDRRAGVEQDPNASAAWREGWQMRDDWERMFPAIQPRKEKT